MQIVKSHFTNELELRPCNDGRNWIVAHVFGLFTPLTGLIVVPSGFLTDLASIPRLFWNILPPFGKYTRAAVIHDFLYRTRICSRKTADRTLLAGMKLCGVPLWQRVLIYGNVRAFGLIAWEDDARHILPPPTHATDTRYGGKHYMSRHD